MTPCLLAVVLLANLFVSHRTVAETVRHLAPLKRILAQVESGIASGEISPRQRLYIQPGITDYLPELCWHKGIGRKMKGTYEGYFPGGARDCFAADLEDAAWILDSPLGIYRRNESFGE